MQITQYLIISKNTNLVILKSESILIMNNVELMVLSEDMYICKFNLVSALLIFFNPLIVHANYHLTSFLKIVLSA